MVITAANVRSTIYIINIYNILCVCVCVCLPYGWKAGKLGTGKVGFSVFSGYLFSFLIACFVQIFMYLRTLFVNES